MVFTYFGDGGVNIGSVPESLNLAALWNLPICFFIENNGYAVSTTLEEETREVRMSSRGLAYGIPSYRVDGMDPVAVRIASEKAIEIMRDGKGPVIIEAVVYRYMHHGGGTVGSAFGYRTKEEEAQWKGRDRLLAMAKEMIARKWLTDDEDAQIRNIAKGAMDEVVDLLTMPDGNKRKVRAELWPDVQFPRHWPARRPAEFKGVRFEEQESFTGKLAETKFIEVRSRA